MDIGEPTLWSGRTECFKYTWLPLSANTSALSQHISYPQFFTFTTMPYPETTDAFAVNDIKNWSTFKRQEVCYTPLDKYRNY